MSVHQPIAGSVRAVPAWTCCVHGCETSVRFRLPDDDGDVRPQYRGQPVCFGHAGLAYWEDVTAEARRCTARERSAAKQRTPGTLTPAAQRKHDAFTAWLKTLSDVGPVELLRELGSAHCIGRDHAERMLRRRAETLCLLLTEGESALLHLTCEQRRGDFQWMDRKGWVLERRKPEGAYTRTYYRLTPKGRAMAQRLAAARAEEAA